MACSTVSYEKALHNYFIPCLYLRKTYGNFTKNTEISLGISENFGNASNSFLEIKLFKQIVLKNVWQSSEVFGKIRRRSKMVLKCSENLRKSSEVFGNSRKTSETAQECFSNDLWLF